MNYEWLDEAPDRVVLGTSSSTLTFLFDTTINRQPSLDNFAKATVKFQNEKVTAVANLDFFSRDIVAFAKKLDRAYKDLNGTIVIMSDDERLKASVQFESTGTVVISGHLQPMYDDPTVITFKIGSNQGYIGPSITALLSLIK